MKRPPKLMYIENRCPKGDFPKENDVFSLVFHSFSAFSFDFQHISGCTSRAEARETADSWHPCKDRSRWCSLRRPRFEHARGLWHAELPESMSSSSVQSTSYERNAYYSVLV